MFVTFLVHLPKIQANQGVDLAYKSGGIWNKLFKLLGITATNGKSAGLSIDGSRKQSYEQTFNEKSTRLIESLMETQRPSAIYTCMKTHHDKLFKVLESIGHEETHISFGYFQSIGRDLSKRKWVERYSQLKSVHRFDVFDNLSDFNNAAEQWIENNNLGKPNATLNV